MTTQATLFKSGIGNVFTEVPKNPKSHVRVWALHWAETLGDAQVLSKGDSLSDLDVFYFDHGVNTEPGAMNLFGGITDSIVDRLEQLVENRTLSVVSLDFPMPVDAYVSGTRKRIGQSSCSKRLTPALVDAFEQKLKKDAGLFMTQADLVTKTVCIGDSHSTAYAKKGQPVIRKNGLTLHGALKNGHFDEVLKSLPVDVESATLVAGSIDIRHHVGLASDPIEAVFELTTQFAELALSLSSYMEVELSTPVPVEYEGRRIPKTGWLNDRPFTGSQEDRALWTSVFADTLRDEYYGPITTPPAEWFAMDPKTYAESIMELSSSVHVAPPFYRRHVGFQ